MSLIKEKKTIKEWVCKQSVERKEWELFSNDVDSYWKLREKSSEIEEYNISDLLEI